MRTYVANRDFEYKTDRFGKPYGWGIALFSLSEEIYGEEMFHIQSGITPKESFYRMKTYLLEQLGFAFEKKVMRLLRILKEGETSTMTLP
jgi:hypothetical protein